MGLGGAEKPLSLFVIDFVASVRSYRSEHTVLRDVQEELNSRIAEKGKITFAEFMALALFWPKGGYYIRTSDSGPVEDFYTAPAAHPTFGALLCLQVYQMWLLLGQPSPFWLVEMGAGSGLLCHDLVRYSRHLPSGFGESLRYVCLDRNSYWGAEEPFRTSHNVQRLAAASVPLRDITGCFLSNELVDSFPLHRVVLHKGRLQEIYVTLQHGQLMEVVGQPSTPELEQRLADLGITLPEGFCTEINLAMRPWIWDVAQAIDRGFVLTIDYGHHAQELYSPARSRGTLTSFYRHIQTGDPYKRIGQQDITALVDFTSLMDMGERCGLETLGLADQRSFLLNLGTQQYLQRLVEEGLRQRELESNRMAMLDIVRPGGLGDFKVLVQGKGVGRSPLWGLERCTKAQDLTFQLPVPLLTQHHLSLLQARYPHLSYQWEELWPGQEGDVTGRH